MKNRLWPVILVLVSFLSACAHPSLVGKAPVKENGYLIRNVDVFTALDEGKVLQDMDVYVRGETVAVISAKRLDIPGAEVIDGQGKMLLPGLVDFHTHITSGMIIPWGTVMPTMRFNMEACLYSGITAIMDMSGKKPAAMNALTCEIEDGNLAGPHLFHCGMGFTGKGAHPIPMVEKMKKTFPWFVRPFFPEIVIEVDDVTDMDRLEDHLAQGPDFTKIYLDDLPDDSPKMRPEIVHEIVKRSHEQGIPVLIHIGRNEDVRVAIDSGADGIAHNVYKEPLDAKLAGELAARGMFVIPTVYVFHNLNAFINEEDYDHYCDLEWETMHPSSIEALHNPEPFISPEGDPWTDYYRHFEETYAGVLHPNVRVLKDAGVTIIAGTDSPNLGMAAGGSLHVELEHLVRGGLTPAEALLAATSAPARILREVFHQDVKFGTIEEGVDADLLLVEGDPTEDIRNTRNIAAVFYQGDPLVRNK